MTIEVEGPANTYSGEERTGEPGIVRLIYHARLMGGNLKSSAEGDAVWMPVEDFILRSARDGPILQEMMAAGSHPHSR
jgi:hypothetical protein